MPAQTAARQKQVEGIFVADPKGFLCHDCIPNELDLGLDTVEVWMEGSHGWTGPCVCRGCGYSIPVFVNGIRVAVGCRVVYLGDPNEIGTVVDVDKLGSDATALVQWDKGGAAGSQPVEDLLVVGRARKLGRREKTPPKGTP
jgi:hypothetical protein